MNTRITGLISVVSCLMTFSMSATAAPPDANAALDLVRQSNCFRCHGIEKGKEGPSWKAVAAKYKGTTDAEAKLYKHLTTGPKVKLKDGHEEEHSKPQTADAGEIKNLVSWILSLN